MLALRGKCDKYIYFFTNHDKEKSQTQSLAMQGEKETAHLVRKGVAVLHLFFLLFFCFVLFCFFFFTKNKAHFVKITDSNLEMIRSLRSEISKLVYVNSRCEKCHFFLIWKSGISLTLWFGGFTQQVMWAHVGLFVYYSTYALAGQDNGACLQLQ